MQIGAMRAEKYQQLNQLISVNFSQPTAELNVTANHQDRQVAVPILLIVAWVCDHVGDWEVYVLRLGVG